MNKTGILAVVAFTVAFLIIEIVWLAPLSKKRAEWEKANRTRQLWLREKTAYEAELAQKNGAGEKGDGTAPPASASETKTDPATPVPPAPPDTTPEGRKKFLEALASQRAGEVTILEGPSFGATLSTKGGALESLAFKDIKESSFRLITHEDKKDLDPDGDLVLSKEWKPSEDPSDYHLTLTVSVENRGKEAKRFGYEIFGPAGMVEPTTCRPQGIQVELDLKDGQGGHATTKGDTLALVKGGKDKKLTLQASPQLNTRISFFGLTAKYFAVVVIPEDKQHPPESVWTETILDLAGRKATAEEMKHAESFVDSIAREATAVAKVPEFEVPPGATVSQDYALYVGPKSDATFADKPLYSNAGLRELAKYGSSVPGADFLAGLLTWVLQALHALTKSWGASIILLTFIVRACLHPLMVKQVRNTLKMQALGPETAKLKEKYSDKDGKMKPEDQRRFQAEQWELMKKHGVNPLGCMGPMLLQFPIFIGLWAALSFAFDLRQSSFLWIRDLSEPDVVARLPFNLPFQGTNALCILPFVMLVVYIVQMRTMPKPADPQAAEQQKIMNWMMPVFGYMFYMFPSGLLLYYITSATLGMIEQRWIKSRLGPPKGPAKGDEARVVPVKV
ncbi:YidC/Oxa1 family insertase periplasmic-domain containing protein [bacterium]|nr:YidC/Oxa1 family insertase periplasmic-domain containing protein [bacterium]